MRNALAGLAIVAVLALCGCRSTLMDFSVLAADSVAVEQVGQVSAAAGAPARGRDAQPVLLGLVPLSSAPTISAAFKKATAASGGNALRNGTIYAYSWTIPFLLDVDGFEVVGEAVTLPAKP